MTAWNRKGLRWRDWTTPELLHVVHQENVEYYREHEPRKLRRYLIDMKDERLLIQLDRASMKSGKA